MSAANSCSGGSRYRTVTGRPFQRLIHCPRKSALLQRQQLLPAPRGAVASSRVRQQSSSRIAFRNTVWHQRTCARCGTRPMPSAPRRLPPVAASAWRIRIGADAAGRRRPSAHFMMRLKIAGNLSRCSPWSGSSPLRQMPVAAIQRDSSRLPGRSDPATVKRTSGILIDARFHRSRIRSSVPMPRATTAACEVMPPRTVRDALLPPRVMPSNILRRRLQTHQNDLFSVLLVRILGVLGGKIDLSGSSARRCRQCLSNFFALLQPAAASKVWCSS